MKKIVSIALVLVMMIAALSVCVSAIPQGCTALDITDTVKFATSTQMYTKGIDLSVIEKVKRSVKIPVVGNGDINSVDEV